MYWTNICNGLVADEISLERSGLHSVQFRRVRNDLIKTSMILKGAEGVHVERMFSLAGETGTRGHYLQHGVVHLPDNTFLLLYIQRLVN